MKPIKPLTVFTLSLIFFWCNYCLAQQHITTLELQNTQPNLLLPAIKAQLAPNSSVSVYKNKLILNVTDSELKIIHQLINKLDAPGRQLLISIKKSDSLNSRQKQGEVSFTRGSNPKIQLSSNPEIKNNRLSSNISSNISSNMRADTKTTVTVTQQSISQSENSKQSIRATEGSPVRISTGNTLIVSNKQNHPNNRPTYSQELIDANTGFFATAWVNGNSVTVKIDQQQQKFVDSKTISSQQLQTQVSGKLGEWIAVGSIGEHSNTFNRQLNKVNNYRQQDAALVYLKVELTR